MKMKWILQALGKIPSKLLTGHLWGVRTVWERIRESLLSKTGYWKHSQEAYFTFEFNRRERWYNILYTYLSNQVFYTFYSFLLIDLTHFLRSLYDFKNYYDAKIPLSVLFSKKLLLVYNRYELFSPGFSYNQLLPWAH